MLRSTGGPAVTVIDGGNPANPDEGSTVKMSAGEITGFDIRNGSGHISFQDPYPRVGGGVYVYLFSGSATVQGNWIHDNVAAGERADGAGVWAFGNVTIRNNRIYRNRVEATVLGSGSGIDASSLNTDNPGILIEGNEIFGNHVEHGSGAVFSFGVIRHNIVACNSVLGSDAFPNPPPSSGVTCGGSPVEGNSIIGNWTFDLEQDAPPYGYGRTSALLLARPMFSATWSHSTSGTESIASRNSAGTRTSPATTSMGTRGDVIGNCGNPIGQAGNISVDPQFGATGLPLPAWLLVPRAGLPAPARELAAGMWLDRRGRRVFPDRNRGLAASEHAPWRPRRPQPLHRTDHHPLLSRQRERSRDRDRGCAWPADPQLAPGRMTIGDHTAPWDGRTNEGARSVGRLHRRDPRRRRRGHADPAAPALAAATDLRAGDPDDRTAPACYDGGRFLAHAIGTHHGAFDVVPAPVFRPARTGFPRLPKPASAVTRTVPTQFPTIQAALNASAAGDTVAVLPGTYVENLLIQRAIVLRSTGGPAVTVIDGGNPANPDEGSTVKMFAGEVTGFDIRNGSGHISFQFPYARVGGGVYVYFSAAARCRETGFTTTLATGERGNGAGVWAFGNVAIRNNRIYRNRIEATVLGSGFRPLCQGHEHRQPRHSQSKATRSSAITWRHGDAAARCSGVFRHNIVACNSVDGIRCIPQPPASSGVSWGGHPRRGKHDRCQLDLRSRPGAPAMRIWANRCAPPCPVRGFRQRDRTSTSAMDRMHPFRNPLGDANFSCNDLYGNTGDEVHRRLWQSDWASGQHRGRS